MSLGSQAQVLGVEVQAQVWWRGDRVCVCEDALWCGAVIVGKSQATCRWVFMSGGAVSGV